MNQHMGSLDRRSFLRGTLATGAAVWAGASAARAAGAPAGVRGVQGGDGPTGPYGPLQPANGDGLMLPAGFTSRLVAVSGETVPGTSHTWHANPDGAACLPALGGGWYLVSNGETGGGGGTVGVLRFNAAGTVVDGYTILSGTTRSCSGGVTPWGTYLSGEEHPTGGVYECDPTGPGQGVHRPGMGTFAHEMIAVDRRRGWIYMVEDDPAGRLYRFRPATRADLSDGTLEVAHVVTSGAATSLGWSPAAADAPARDTGSTAFAGAEGAWIERNHLYLTTKFDVRVWRVDLRDQRLSVFYDHAATPSAPLDAVDNLVGHPISGDLYVAEDGGNMEVCILPTLGRTACWTFLRFVGHDQSEVTGVAFDPSATRLYVSSQRGVDGSGGVGRTYEVTGPFRHRLPERLIRRRL
ncbi:MAG: DUF839 domain-containing protein [Ilumatobacteraceae bacterium]